MIGIIMLQDLVAKCNQRMKEVEDQGAMRRVDASLDVTLQGQPVKLADGKRTLVKRGKVNTTR